MSAYDAEGGRRQEEGHRRITIALVGGEEGRQRGQPIEAGQQVAGIADACIAGLGQAGVEEKCGSSIEEREGEAQEKGKGQTRLIREDVETGGQQAHRGGMIEGVLAAVVVGDQSLFQDCLGVSLPDFDIEAAVGEDGKKEA